MTFAIHAFLAVLLGLQHPKVAQGAPERRSAMGHGCVMGTEMMFVAGVPNKGGQNQRSKPPLGVTMMPLGAPSISKYGSLVRPNAQIVALRAHCA